MYTTDTYLHLKSAHTCTHHTTPDLFLTLFQAYSRPLMLQFSIGIVVPCERVYVFINFLRSYSFEIW